MVAWLALLHAITDEGDRCRNCSIRRVRASKGRCMACYHYRRIHGVERPTRPYKASTVRVKAVAVELAEG